MERWQKEHITTNLTELINLTTCNTDLISRLTSKGFLSDSDLEVLEAITTKMDKNNRFYKILMMRKAYFELIEALHGNGQQEVCKILWTGAIKNKMVRFQTTDIMLSEILTCYNVTIPKVGEKLDENFKQDLPILVNNSVRSTPKYYIERVISRSPRISSDIFQTPGDDVFVLTGLQRYELTTLASGMNTDVSSNQITNVTVQFINLENDSHFDNICNITTRTVHLIEYSGDDKFNWIKSRGSLETIRKFVQDEELHMSENEFIKACLKSNRPVCIADSPGMGKSFMLTKMAQTIMDENPFQLVRFLQFTDFLVKLKQPVTQDSVCNAIAELSSDFEIGQELVSTSLKSDEKVSYLFFDGFDEISPNQVAIVEKILTHASNLKKARVYAATRLHMRQQLEDMVGGLGFTLLPFREEEQIEFLVKFWSDGAPETTEKLQNFARICLKSLRTVIGDQNIAGTPLICSIIARIYQHGAKEYSTSVLSKPPLPRTISTIFELYKVFMNDGFSKIVVEKQWWDIQQKNIRVDIEAHHKKLAVVDLFPKWRDKLTKELPKIDEKKRSLMFLPGILEPGSDSRSYNFLHRTFAEFLVADFIAEAFDEEPQNNKNGIVDYAIPAMLFMSALLPSSQIPYSYQSFPVQDQTNNTNNWVGKLLIEDILSTHYKKNLVQLRIGREVILNSYEFEQPTICYFLDALVKTRGAPRSSLGELISTQYQGHFVKMYTAAVVSDKPAITNLLSGIFICKCEYLPWSELFVLAAKHAGVEMTSQLTELHKNVFGKLPANLQYPVSRRIAITPIHIAAQMGNYNLFECLWNKSGFREGFSEGYKNVQYLLHECVSGTFLETPEVVTNKLQIINLILSDGGKRNLETITEERLPRDACDGSTPILQPNIHVDMFKCLISKGAQLTHNNKRENPLHIAAINGNLPVAEFLITNHSSFVQISDEAGNTPLHLAFLNGTKPHVDIQMKLIEAGADIYTANTKGCNPFMNGIKYGKGLEVRVVKTIESIHPQFLSAFGGLGLKSLLTNSNLMVLNWDKSLEEVAEYLIVKGAVVMCRSIESPWGLEQVESNMNQIVESIEITERLEQRLQRFNVLNKNTEISNKQQLFEILKEAQGSYEKLMVSLMKCKQMKTFLIMKQCLQSDDNNSVWFVKPPPGVLDFIVDPEPRVFILQTYHCQCSAIRIRDTVYPDLFLEDLGEFSNERSSGVIFCRSQTNLDEILPSLLLLVTKTIIIVNETAILAQLDMNDRKFVRTAFDKVNWNDLSGTVRTELTSPLKECKERLEISDSFLHILVKNCFENKTAVFDFEIDSLKKFSETFVKFAFLGMGTKEPEACWVKLAVESKYPNSIGVFKKGEVDNSEVGIFPPRNDDNILEIEYFVALLIVNEKYRVYLDMEMFVKFVECVVFKCKNKSDCPSSVNSKICEYVNLLLESCEVHAFHELLDKLDEISRKNIILSSAKCNYLEILKVFVTSCKSDDGKCGIDKGTMGSVIMNGSFESVAYLYDLYAKWNECLIVEYNDELWLALRLAAHRGDHAIVEHIIQYHGYEFEPHNYLLVDKQLISINARIVKRQVNQPGIYLDEIGPEVIPIIKSRNIRLLYVAIDFGADVCSQDEDGFTVLHEAPEFLTPVQYHELVEYLINSNKTKCFIVLDIWGNTILHRAVLNLEVLPETLDLYKSQNVDFNAITDENTHHGSSVLHLAVEGKRSVNMINKLIECGANVKATNKDGNGLLHFAVQFENVPAIPLLVSLGCSVKSVNKYQNTPLHRAFHNSKDSLVEVVRLLTEHNSDLNAKGYRGRTPLHSAVKLCKSSQVVRVIRFLIENGADVNIQDDDGNTMLLVSLKNLTLFDYHQIVQIIEKTSPACLEKRNKYELTTLHVAVRCLEIKSDTLKLLIKYVGINAVDNKGFPPLFLAIEGGRSREVIIMMIDNGADSTMRDNYQTNALHWSACFGNVPAVEYFLEPGEIGVNKKDEGGNTPLHYAFQENNEHVHAVVRLLLEAGGDVNLKNNSGRSPLNLAVEEEKKNKVDMKTVTLMKNYTRIEYANPMKL